MFVSSDDSALPDKPVTLVVGHKKALFNYAKQLSRHTIVTYYPKLEAFETQNKIYKTADKFSEGFSAVVYPLPKRAKHDPIYRSLIEVLKNEQL